jgi:alpha-tubulin suppressor-like RCC1 family protein
MLKLDNTLACWNAPYSVPTGQFTAISTGDDHSCGIRLDGSIDCFGSNSAGQIGNAPGGSNWIAISSGAEHSCAIDDTNFVTCWGDNSHGQTAAATGQFDTVAAGLAHTCAVRPDLSIVCWGCSGQDLGQCSPPR